MTRNFGWVGVDGVQNILDTLGTCYHLHSSDEDSVVFTRSNTDSDKTYTEVFPKIEIKPCKCGAQNCLTVNCIFYSELDSFYLMQPIASIEFFDVSLIRQMMTRFKMMADFQMETMSKLKLSMVQKRKSLEKSLGLNF